MKVSQNGQRHRDFDEIEPWAKIAAILALIVSLVAYIIPIFGPLLVTPIAAALAALACYGGDFHRLGLTAAVVGPVNLLISPTVWILFTDAGRGSEARFSVLFSALMFCLSIYYLVRRPQLPPSQSASVSYQQGPTNAAGFPGAAPEPSSPSRTTPGAAFTHPAPPSPPSEFSKPLRAPPPPPTLDQGLPALPGFYQAEISRERPACLLFLIDQSGSMADSVSAGGSKAKFVADVLNKTLYSIAITCSKADGVRDYFHVGVIGYGGNGLVRDMLGSGAEGLRPISEIAEHPLRVDDRVRLVADGAGGLVERTAKFPVWIDPEYSGGTPMRAALSRAKTVVAGWCVAHPTSYPPTIIHVTDGESTDGDPSAIASEVSRIGTEDGCCLLFNIHVSSAEGGAIRFPSTDGGISDRYASLLFSISSRLPPHIISQASERGYKVEVGARGYIFNADPLDIVNFFDIGTRPRSLR